MSPAPATPPGTPAKGNLSKWLAGHKWEAGLGAGGIVVTVYLAYRSRQNAASGSTSSSGGTSASQALPASYYPPTSGGGDGFANELAPILTQLSTELGTAGQGGAGSGSALVSGTIGSGSGDFSLVPSPQANQQLAQGGVTQYTEPIPGEFVEVPVSTGVTNVNPGGLPNANAPTTYIKNP